MKKNCLKLLVLPAFIFCQCAPSTPKESKNSGDTVAIVSEPPTEVSITTPVDEPVDISINMEDFTKHPFESDYPNMKKSLKDASVNFTLIADTIDSEHRVILFDSSRIDFLDSDPNYQDELGDLICSADIRSPKFYFNQGVTIGMPQSEFLNRANLAKSSLLQDKDTGYVYLENEIPFDDGHWKIIIWFKAGLLVRIQSEISPCFYDYGD